MDFINECRKISSEFAEWVTCIAEKDFSFEGEYPLSHSSYNHEHLWKLEYMADYYSCIDLSFRCKVANYIIEKWKKRLKGYKPYNEKGFRVYVYQDTAPTISVVAETEYGFPYAGEVLFVDEIEDIMKEYANRSWKANFIYTDKIPDSDEILNRLEKNKGSISSTAKEFGIGISEFRRMLEWFDIGKNVNQIRKKYRRRPANIADCDDIPHRFKLFELRLPAKY